MKKNEFDFSGWATKNDIVCADGRTIRKNAFKDDDGRTVPLVYQHNHDDVTRVIGHALLQNKNDGVYAYCSLNNTEMGQHAKECIRHGDLDSLSIFANKLVQRGGDVVHGVIREVSLVLSGANPEARIEFPILAHGEESETEAQIWHDDAGLEFGPGMDILQHADEEEEEKPAPKAPEKEEKAEKKEAPKEDKEETVQDVLNSMTDKQRKVLEYLVGQALGGEEADDEDEDKEVKVSHADTDEDKDGGDETVQDVLDTMNDKQRKVTEYLVAQALESAEEDEEDDENDEEEASHADLEGEEFTMKKNVFDNTEMDQNVEETLTHAQMETLFKDAKKIGSLRNSVLEHSAEYGIDQIDWLFPDARNIQNTPGFIQRDMGWVTKVMNGTSHTPFTRIKTMFADITEAEARAKGYIKGHMKKVEVFKMLKRTTDPQTIYKKQKLDRDDILDITDFDVVAWMKTEMRTMLDEEIARAILVGDGREEDAEDHISEDHVRSIFRDEELYVIRRELTPVTGEDKAKTLIKVSRKAWKDYKGSGNCVAFTTEDALSDLMLLEDGIGHFLYPTKDAAASVLRVQDIITVPVMDEKSTYRIDSKTHKAYKPVMIIVNLKDYNVGADKGGSVNMFEDFDIDYNQNKYLMETRISGALIRPYSAIVIEEETTIPESGTETNTPAGDENTGD